MRDYQWLQKEKQLNESPAERKVAELNESLAERKERLPNKNNDNIVKKLQSSI